MFSSNSPKRLTAAAVSIEMLWMASRSPMLLQWMKPNSTSPVFAACQPWPDRVARELCSQKQSLVVQVTAKTTDVSQVLFWSGLGCCVSHATQHSVQIPYWVTHWVVACVEVLNLRTRGPAGVLTHCQASKKGVL